MNKNNKYLKEVGLMVDLSRGKVLTIDTLKKLIKNAHKFGFTYINLYIEDLLTLEDYPQYGYLRGRYSDEEIISLVSYCKDIGIEIYPAIQTLGHMEHFLRWDASDNLRDTDKVINVTKEETYIFLEILIKKCQQLFGGAYINIGMDEAFDLGQGTVFRDGNTKSQKDLYLEHLRKVINICKDNSYEHIKVWSDMLLSVYSNTSGDNLYSTDFKSEIEQLDDDVELIFWNYWSEKKEHYTDVLDAHFKFSKNVSMALGIHTWGLPFYDLDQLNITKLGLEAAYEKGIDDILFTMWGDDGSIYNLDSTYLGMYETMCYIKGSTPNEEEFESITNLNYNILKEVSLINRIGVNPLHIIWNDPITNIFLKTLNDNKVYEIKSNSETMLIKGEDEHALIFNIYLKCINNDINIYLSDNIDDKLLDKAIFDLQQLFKYIEKLWLKEAKINGLELIQLRFTSKIYRYEFLKEQKNNIQVKEILVEKATNIKKIKSAYNRISKATNFRW